MQIKSTVVSMCGTNCYIVNNEGRGFIVDPGDDGDRIAAAVEQMGVEIEAILITHAHFDHMGAAAEMADKYKVKVYICEKEEPTLSDPGVNLSVMAGRAVSYKADVFLKDEEEFDVAGLHIRMLHTPGHTPGGCCYYLPYEDVIFTGDTLFNESVGRTDFPGGSMSELVNGIRNKLMVLPGNTICYPGHNSPTTIENERMYNPYL